ncbi:hypothetical protein BN1058_02100 [Paraliobacillus sp. PM-2]|nr:hypothetical protein BN1058_02100 [Paraliobacillus sp. PM-2]
MRQSLVGNCILLKSIKEMFVIKNYYRKTNFFPPNVQRNGLKVYFMVKCKRVNLNKETGETNALLRNRICNDCY